MKNNAQRWWDIPAALFITGAVFAAAVRLTATNWTGNLGWIEVDVVLAVICGFALGKSIFRGRTTFFFGLVYSLFFVPWQMGLMVKNMDWPDRLYYLYARLWYAVADLLANKPVKDPILFLSTMMLLYWFASLLSAYQMIRRANPWIPLLSLGGMILIIEYSMEMYRYAKVTGAVYSFIYLVFCLFLLGRIYFLRSKKSWEQHGGTVELEVGYDLGRGVAVAAVVLALIAWNTPSLVNFFESGDPTRERVTQSWQKFRDRISKAVNSLRSSSPVVVESYGNNMFLGTGGNQSEDLMLNVRPVTGQAAERLYWTARSYDQYQDGQWLSTISGTEVIGPAKGTIRYPAWNLRHEASFTFLPHVPLLKTLYYTSEPLGINREAEAVVSVSKEGWRDVNAIILDPPLKAGEEYTIRAWVVQPTVLAMRESTEDYPEWIKQRYLQVPANFSPRVVNLARQIAGEEKTPYDKAVAITQYLRRTITYNITVPDPPAGRDPLEWFLFDLRSGFCNYYASAEVMMLRSLGVPARLSVGYAQGAWDPETETYLIVGKDAHAWPEVYFNSIGWVTFEPTVSQPLTTYPMGEKSTTDSSSSTNAPSQQPTFDPYQYMPKGDTKVNPEDLKGLGQKNIQISPWLVAFITILVIVGVLAFMNWRRRKREDLPLASWLEKTFDERGFRTPGWLRMWSRRALRTPMENLFATVGYMLKVWGYKLDPALTPAEQVAVLVNVVPGIQAPALILLEEYQRAMYSQYPANMLRAMDAVSEIRSVGYRGWVLRLVGFES